MKKIILLSFLIIGCSLSKKDSDHKGSYSYPKNVTVYFWMAKKDLNNKLERSTVVAKESLSYPFSKDKVILKSKGAQCTYEIDAYNYCVENGIPLLTLTELNHKITSITLAELFPTTGNGLIQHSDGDFHCFASWKEGQ